MDSNLTQRRIGNMGIAAIMLISSLTVMVGNAITPALPELGRVYGLGSYASWLVTAPALGVVATAILFGKLIDKKGPYWVALIGLLFYGICGVAGAYMPNVAAKSEIYDTDHYIYRTISNHVDGLCFGLSLVPYGPCGKLVHFLWYFSGNLYNYDRWF